MNVLWEELTAGLGNQDQVLRVMIRLCTAILCGAFIGLQKVRATKPSGLRTHTMVCLGTTLVLLSCSSAGISREAIATVVQGIVIGIGFVGAGSILKSSEEHLIHGLTASVRLWTTATIGIAIGLGRVGIGVIATILIVLLLNAISTLEGRMGKRPPLPNQPRR
jgi:putative Mg2+ transporter-C (MgtC) family protein